MDKKELYEHLAKIYLDSSRKHQRKRKNQQYLIKPLHLYIGLAILVLILSPFLIKTIFSRNDTFSSEYRTALVIQPDVIKLNYNFSAAKKEIYTIPLKDLNLSSYKVLAFTAKKSQEKGNVSLRIELTNSFKEKSEVYISGLSSKWKDYSINLDSFKKITDWSEIKELLFIVEEWNTKEKNNVVYIENIKFLK
ncbi:MAG: hypothetical protein NC936_05630 [Candidatus Omnitrophica bacterium]|nr:hypothetical protein [Candidatus Omnitrophota bacterium]